MKASKDFAKFFRFEIAMSRHISGEPDAMRVVSRKPVAQSAACCFGFAGFKTRFANVAATTCGKWLVRLTSKSCCSGGNFNTRAPSDFQNCSKFFSAAEFVLRVGVKTQTAFENKSARAAETPVFSPPAIG